MIVKRVNLCALDTGSLTLGYVGENDHTQIRINCASVFADYPAAVVSMTVKAPSGVVYPREVETDGQIVIWTITDSDTASAGNGQIQLTFTEDGTIVKTVIAVTTVRASLVGDNPPPDPITDWIDEAGEALAKLEGLTASATELPAGEDPTAEVEVVDGHYNIALGIPGGDADSIIDDTAGVGDTTKVWSANKSATDLSELKSDIDGKAPVILRDASGDIVSFTDGADGMPLSACTVQVNPVQSGTGDPSPTNIRPITGVTTATLNRSNENLWDNSFYSPLTLITDPNDTYYGFYSGSIKSWAESYGPNFHKGQYGRISVTAEYGCYKDSGTGSFIFRVYFYYSDGSESYGSNISVDHGEKKIATRISDEGKTCISYIISTSAGATNNSGRIRNVMVAPYGAGYDFVEPNHQTYPITFPTEAGTVYGGTVDLAAKTLTVTDGQIASYAGETLPGAWISDRDVYTPGGTPTTGAQVVYKLATPLVYTLTDLPTITTLPGYNAIWSDTGAVAVTYPADTKTYVDDHTPVQDVQINGTSILSNGVANVPVATSSESGVVQAANWYGVEMNGTALRIFRALESDIKAGTHAYRPITPSLQQNSVFYALAKLAGADMASSSSPVGQYTDAAKDKIMKMIGILDMIAPYESTGVATRAYGVGDCFIQGGHLYRATASISIGVSFSASNCEQTTLMAEINR